jgi:hypothetical protein
MAQNEDDAVQRHRDMRMVMLTKSIESTERLVELKMKMADRMGVDGSENDNLMAINRLLEKLEQLNADLALMVSEVRLTNPIVKKMCWTTRKKRWGCSLRQQTEMTTKRRVGHNVMRITIMKTMLMMLEIS